jgi:hypothetical protein
MFKYLKMNSSDVWKILLFKDRFDYAGIRDPSDGRVVCDFDLTNHLPPRVATIFMAKVGKFLKLNEEYLYEKKNKIIHDPVGSVNMQVTNVSVEHRYGQHHDPYVDSDAAIYSMAHLDLVKDLAELEDVQFSRNLLQTGFANEIFEALEEIKVKKNKADSDFKACEREGKGVNIEE